MALTNSEVRIAARELARKLFVETNQTATLNLDDLIAAVGSIDVAMDTVISAIPAGWQTKTIKQALVDNLPEPFQSTSTSQQKAMVLVYWAMKETGLI